MVEKLKGNNTLTIPKTILKHVGLKAGDYVEVTDDGYKIVIMPKIKEEDFTDEEWEKLEKLSREKGGKTFKTGKTLLRHLDKPSKK